MKNRNFTLEELSAFEGFLTNLIRGMNAFGGTAFKLRKLRKQFSPKRKFVKLTIKDRQSVSAILNTALKTLDTAKDLDEAATIKIATLKTHLSAMKEKLKDAETHSERDTLDTEKGSLSSSG